MHCSVDGAARPRIRAGHYRVPQLALDPRVDAGRPAPGQAPRGGVSPAAKIHQGLHVQHVPSRAQHPVAFPGHACCRAHGSHAQVRPPSHTSLLGLVRRGCVHSRPPRAPSARTPVSTPSCTTLLPSALLPRTLPQVPSHPSSPFLRHSPALRSSRHDKTGHTDSKRAFINRMFISQLNEAQKAVARQLRMPIIDW